MKTIETTKEQLESAVRSIKTKKTECRLKNIIDGVILSEAEVLKKWSKYDG